MEYHKQLALELHFSSLPSFLALSLYRLALEKSYSSLRQIGFAEWQRACHQSYLDRSEPVQLPQSWDKWQSSLGRASKISARCLDNGDQVLVYGSKEYPQQLYRLYRAPFVLFARGRVPDWQAFSGFAVCGSRKASLQGKRDAFALAYGVCKQSRFRLVSGLTEGIEFAACCGAAKGALQRSSQRSLQSQTPGGVIGVLCSGLDAVSTASLELRKMAGQILESGGLLLSEYPPWQARQRFAFLQRNRILAALASSLIMVELNPKSKAFNLVEYALELNHDVACVGHSVGIERLRDQGCAHWENGLELLQTLGIEVRVTGVQGEEATLSKELLAENSAEESVAELSAEKSFPEKTPAKAVTENLRAELSGIAHEYLGYRFV